MQNPDCKCERVRPAPVLICLNTIFTHKWLSDIFWKYAKKCKHQNFVWKSLNAKQTKKLYVHEQEQSVRPAIDGHKHSKLKTNRDLRSSSVFT
jgi:hypothetical protein